MNHPKSMFQLSGVHYIGAQWVIIQSPASQGSGFEISGLGVRVQGASQVI